MISVFKPQLYTQKSQFEEKATAFILAFVSGQKIKYFARDFKQGPRWVLEHALVIFKVFNVKSVNQL